MNKKERQELKETLKTANYLLGKFQKRDRRIRRLEEALDRCLEVLSFIRYQDWPTEGLGIGLRVETVDEALIEGELVLPKSPKQKRKGRHTQRLQKKKKTHAQANGKGRGARKTPA